MSVWLDVKGLNWKLQHNIKITPIFPPVLNDDLVFGIEAPTHCFPLAALPVVWWTPQAGRGGGYQSVSSLGVN